MMEESNGTSANTYEQKISYERLQEAWDYFGCTTNVACNYDGARTFTAPSSCPAASDKGDVGPGAAGAGGGPGGGGGGMRRRRRRQAAPSGRIRRKRVAPGHDDHDEEGGIPEGEIDENAEAEAEFLLLYMSLSETARRKIGHRCGIT